MQIKALLLDDDRAVCESVKQLLELEGFYVEYILDPCELLNRIEQEVPDILLLDQNLSGQKGTDWLQTIRKKQRYMKLPIIMLTGEYNDSEKVRALDFGADDYVVKPFSPTELAARIRAVLRRLNPTSEKFPKIEANGLSIDKLAHEVVLNGEVIPVTLTEFNIIYELLKNINEVLTRDHLREMALGKSNVTDRTIDVHMAALRKKLGDWAEDICTIRGVGYRYAQKSDKGPSATDTNF